MIWLLVFLVGCTRGPGLTPMEQAGLEKINQPLKEGLIYTVDEMVQPEGAALVLAMLSEYEKTPIFLQVVWRGPAAPQTSELAWFRGKRIRQYWDPGGLTPSTSGKLRAAGQTVAIEPLPLRIAFARAAVAVQN